MGWLARAIETAILQSRWLLAPFLLGLIIGLGALLYTFLVKLTAFLGLVKAASEEEVIVGVLKLVDLSLTANLLLIVICSGYENFVARIGRTDQAGWPDRDWVRGLEAEAARLDFGDRRHQRTRMVYGYRPER